MSVTPRLANALPRQRPAIFSNQLQKRDGAKKMEEQAKVGRILLRKKGWLLCRCVSADGLAAGGKPLPRTNSHPSSLPGLADMSIASSSFLHAPFSCPQALASEAASEARAAQKARVTVSCGSSRVCALLACCC